MIPETILVICSANVCRSPLAERILTARIGTEGDVVVESAGARARDGAPVCSLALESLRMRGVNGEPTETTSRRVTDAMLRGAALILVADHQVSNDVIALEPSARDRTHTLREAAHRGRGFSSTAEGRGRVAEFAAFLDRARLTAPPMPASRRWRPRRAAAPDPADIADRHGGGSRGHARTVQEVISVTEEIAAQLARQ